MATTEEPKRPPKPSQEAIERARANQDKQGVKLTAFSDVGEAAKVFQDIQNKKLAKKDVKLSGVQKKESAIILPPVPPKKVQSKKPAITSPKPKLKRANPTTDNMNVSNQSPEKSGIISAPKPIIAQKPSTEELEIKKLGVPPEPPNNSETKQSNVNYDEYLTPQNNTQQKNQEGNYYDPVADPQPHLQDVQQDNSRTSVKANNAQSWWGKNHWFFPINIRNLFGDSKPEPTSQLKEENQYEEINDVLPESSSGSSPFVEHVEHQYENTTPLKNKEPKDTGLIDGVVHVLRGVLNNFRITQHEDNEASISPQRKKPKIEHTHNLNLGKPPDTAVSTAKQQDAFLKQQQGQEKER